MTAASAAPSLAFARAAFSAYTRQTSESSLLGTADTLFDAASNSSRWVLPSPASAAVWP